MKQLLVMLLLLCSAAANAQDVIVKKDGSTVVCRVVELTESEIVYKKWSALNGSNYVMERSAASAINYQNGKKVILSETTNLYRPNNQNEGMQQYNDRALLLLDETYTNYSNKKIKTLKTLGWIGGGVLLASSAAFFILDWAWEFDDGWPTPIWIGCAAGAAIWTTSFLLAANHQKKKYQMLQSSIIYQHNFQFSNGSTLSAGIDMLCDRTINKNTLGLGLRYNF